MILTEEICALLEAVRSHNFNEADGFDEDDQFASWQRDARQFASLAFAEVDALARLEQQPGSNKAQFLCLLPTKHGPHTLGFLGLQRRNQSKSVMLVVITRSSGGPAQWPDGKAKWPACCWRFEGPESGGAEGVQSRHGYYHAQLTEDLAHSLSDQLYPVPDTVPALPIPTTSPPGLVLAALRSFYGLADKDRLKEHPVDRWLQQQAAQYPDLKRDWDALILRTGANSQHQAATAPPQPDTRKRH